MNLPTPDEFAIARQAAQWYEILNCAGPTERAAFAKWLKASHGNLREFLMMTALNAELRGIDPRRERDVAAILAEAQENVVPLAERPLTLPVPRENRPTPFQRLHRSRWRATTVLMACGFAMAAVMCGVWLMASLTGGNYTTGVGEQRTVALPDGSIAYVNTQSRISVDYSSDAREIRLVEGEALFKVAQDAQRPFTVHIGGSAVQAVGTQFTVYRQDTRLSVAVVDGRVRLFSSHTGKPLLLDAGHGAYVDATATYAMSPDDVRHATDWRQRRLAFRGATLAQMAAEFNRYNRSPQLLVKGEALRKLTFTANFEADDPKSLVGFLSRYAEVDYERKGDVVVIRPRK